jgi:hypothetical protein
MMGDVSESSPRIVNPHSPCVDGQGHDWSVQLTQHVLGESGQRIVDPFADDEEWRECPRCGNIAGWPKPPPLEAGT